MKALTSVDSGQLGIGFNSNPITGTKRREQINSTGWNMIKRISQG
jgi:hypothetical protein